VSSASAWRSCRGYSTTSPRASARWTAPRWSPSRRRWTILALHPIRRLHALRPEGLTAEFVRGEGGSVFAVAPTRRCNYGSRTSLSIIRRSTTSPCDGSPANAGVTTLPQAWPAARRRWTPSAFVEFYNATLDHYLPGCGRDRRHQLAGRVGRLGTGRAVTCRLSQHSDQTVLSLQRHPGRRTEFASFTRDRRCSLVDRSALEARRRAVRGQRAEGDGTCASRRRVPSQMRVPLIASVVRRPNHRFTTERAVVATMVAGC
jgi:hypothetical protein